MRLWREAVSVRRVKCARCGAEDDGQRDTCLVCGSTELQLYFAPLVDPMLIDGSDQPYFWDLPEESGDDADD